MHGGYIQMKRVGELYIINNNCCQLNRNKDCAKLEKQFNIINTYTYVLSPPPQSG